MLNTNAVTGVLLRGQACALALVLAITAGISHALDSDSEQPATLEADSFELDMKSGERIYRGNVIYRQGSIRLECDELVTNFNPEGELDKAVCTGDPGKFKQRPEDSEEDMLGEARVITLDQIAELVTLESRAEVMQGGTKLNGRLLTYNLQTEKVMAEGQTSAESGGVSSTASTTGADDAEGDSEATGVEVQQDGSRPTIVIQPRKKKATE